MKATRAWGYLVALSAASTLIAVSGRAGLAASLLILALAWAKAWIVLRHYLGLAAAPAWARGFALALAGYMVLVIGLVAMAGRA